MDLQENKWNCCHDNETPAHQVLSKYMRIMKLHRSILEQRLNKTGVYRSQQQILRLLSDHSNVSQKEIAEFMNVSPSTIAVSVKKLEKGGYITRIVDQDDNRFNKLCLTEAGKDIVKHSRIFFRNVENQMFHGFSEEDYAAMERFLDRVYQNLEEIMTDKPEGEEEAGKTSSGNRMTEREDL